MRGSVVQGDSPWLAKRKKLVHGPGRQGSEERGGRTAGRHGVWAEDEEDIQIPPPKEAESNGGAAGSQALALKCVFFYSVNGKGSMVGVTMVIF